jgi:GLPGLI family protein
MKKIFFLLLISNICLSQPNSGKIIYNCYYNETRATDDLKTKNKFLYEEYFECESIAKQLTFELIFNKESSKFSSLRFLPSDEFKPIYVEITKSVFKHDDQYYTYLNKDSIFEYALYYNGMREIKLSTKDYQWTLHNETKKIGDYLCYKATTEHKFYWNGKDRIFPVVAWYCPELPFNFSPLRYGGALPGLVLELSESYKTWVAIKIETSDKVISFSLPKKTEGFDNNQMEKDLQKIKEN